MTRNIVAAEGIVYRLCQPWLHAWMIDRSIHLRFLVGSPAEVALIFGAPCLTHRFRAFAPACTESFFVFGHARPQCHILSHTAVTPDRAGQPGPGQAVLGPASGTCRPGLVPGQAWHPNLNPKRDLRVNVPDSPPVLERVLHLAQGQLIVSYVFMVSIDWNSLSLVPTLFLIKEECGPVPVQY